MGKATLNPLKAKIRAKEFIKQGFNATKAIQVLEPEKSYAVAKDKGQNMLSNPVFVASVIEELEERGITNELLDKRLREIIVQTKHLPTSLGAIIEANKMKRRVPKETSDTYQQFNFNVKDPEAIDKRIKEIDAELAKLPSNQTPAP